MKKGEVMQMLKLKRSYELISVKHPDHAELRDAARSGQVVFSGTYAECVKEARVRGLWYSK